MFDLDSFLADCVAAANDPAPHLAVKATLQRVLAEPGELARALPPERAELVRLYASPQLTVLKVVWAPGMSIWPHDHRMWAAIGIYTGGEDNAFYRRSEPGLVESGGTSLRPGDLCLLGDDTIHAVFNPTSVMAGAIHIYGGDFFATPRSEWDPETREERPYDLEAALAHFEDQNG